MSELLRPQPKYRHLYAIVRYQNTANALVPIDLRITVKKVVVDPHYADQEVKRLNALNKDKDCFYFSTITRYEDVPILFQEPASPLTAVEESRG